MKFHSLKTLDIGPLFSHYAVSSKLHDRKLYSLRKHSDITHIKHFRVLDLDTLTHEANPTSKKGKKDEERILSDLSKGKINAVGKELSKSNH